MNKYIKIVLHSIVWFSLVVLLNSKTFDLSWGGFDRSNGSLFIPLLYGIAFGAFIFYLNIYRLIPKYFGKKKSKKYLWIALGWFLGISLLEMALDVVVLITENLELAKQSIKQESTTSISLWGFMIFVSAIIPNLGCWILAFAYRLPKDWIMAEKEKNQLEKDKLKSELDFLKAQINPHFLFNGINSIYHLIGEDDDIAKKTLLQFSGLLRYQLYDCSVNSISLEREVTYISNYMHIEKVRKGEDVMFQLELPQFEENPIYSNYKIAPLLFTPFLENAFKYVSFYSNREKNFINLNLKITDSGILHFTLSNSFDDTLKRNEISVGGIGLNNVKRRLNLLYPNEKHQLNITEYNNVFLVKLMINLNEN